MSKPVDEKKKEKMTIELSTAIPGWSLASPHEPHVLGAIITILHELVHVVCRIFCTTWTPEKVRGSHMPASVPMLNPGGWEWEQNVLSEMQVVFGGRRLD
jgi:hypothetical protein